MHSNWNFKKRKIVMINEDFTLKKRYKNFHFGVFCGFYIELDKRWAINFKDYAVYYTFVRYEKVIFNRCFGDHIGKVHVSN